MPRWVKLCLSVAAVLLAGLLATGAYVWANLTDIVAGRASHATGRTVKIGALHVSPGRWIRIDLHDASIANLPGGTRSELATLARLSAEISLWPLLHGTVIARAVRIEQADILLERVGQQPNWRNGPRRPEQPGGGRDGFPTLLGAEMSGTVTVRTMSGKVLVTTLDGVTLEASASDQPVHLSGPTSYRSVPIALDARLGSFDQLHDLAVKLPADITLTSADTVLHFTGTMTRPLQIDGADGQLSLVAPTPAVLEEVAGASPSPAPPLRLAGPFQHEEHRWTMQNAKGSLGEAVLEDGTLSLEEGSSETKTPDHVALDLRFGPVDANRLLAGLSGPGDGSGFVPKAAPNPEISAKLQAPALTYEKVKLTQPKLTVALGPRQLAIEAASFGALGGQVQLEAQLRAGDDGKTGTLSATLSGTGLDVSELRRAFGVERLALAGRMDVHAIGEGTGASAASTLAAGRASVLATMRGGSVSQELVELASTDPAGLFRSPRAMVPLTCLLAAMEFRGGLASVGPVRLRSSQGTIMARGQLDLAHETIDVVVASEARTTGALALDIPVRVTGRIADPTLVPAGAAAGRAARAGGAVAPSLRPYAQPSGCAG